MSEPGLTGRSVQQEVAAEMGREADAIVSRGEYRAPGGQTVSIVEALSRAQSGTTYYPPDGAVDAQHRGGLNTEIQIRNESAIRAGLRLLDEGFDPVILNFASGTHPGGGYRSGARAQEESLARSSGLVACIETAAAFYERHRKSRDPLFSDGIIYSPDVPFFRGPDHRILDQPRMMSVMTAAAPIATQLAGRMDEIIEAFERRTRRILDLGIAQNHNAIVLGAWGCGAYGNSPSLVAEIFCEAIEERGIGRYRIITFAILDRTPDLSTITPFEQVLEQCSPA